MATKTTSKKPAAKKSTATKADKSTKSAKTIKSAKSTNTTKASTAKRGSSTKGSRSTKQNDRPVIRRAKSTSWMAIMESLVVGALGVLLLVNPEGMFKVIFYVVGIFLIIKGVYKIINYFAVHGKYDFYNNDLLYGIIALVFGVLAVVLWEQLGKLIGIAVGAWMIYGALVRMNTAIKMHTAGIKEWFYVLLLSMIMLALGIYMVISASAIPMVIGWIMIAAAGIGIVDDILFIRHLDAVTN